METMSGKVLSPPPPLEPTADQLTFCNDSKEIAHCYMVVFAFHLLSAHKGWGRVWSWVTKSRLDSPSQWAPSTGVMRDPPR